MQKVTANLSEMTKNGSIPDLVAKVVLNAVSSQNPNLRYLVEYGKHKH
jgi:hypothetical protein